MKESRSYLITSLSAPTKETFPDFQNCVAELCRDNGAELKALKVYSGPVCANIYLELEGDFIGHPVKGINLIASVLAYNLKTDWSFTEEKFESGYSENLK